MEQVLGPAQWLRHAYEERRQRNPRYSQRAFSRFLGISSGRLCELMSGKREIGPALASRISERLALAPNEYQAWLHNIERRRQSRVRRQRLGALLRPTGPEDGAFVELSGDRFRYIADWYHLAILNLARTSDFQSDIAWMAQRLGITEVQAQHAVDRLKRLGLLGEENGKLIRRESQLKSTNEIPSTAIRKNHRQTLELAAESLEEVPMELRDISSMVMAISPRRLSDAKNAVRNFRRELAMLLEEEESDKTEVYSLSIALFPVSNRNPAVTQ
jgi:uncharacterized protein (TIGR02147 family)